MRLIVPLILLIPMSFIFHFIETSTLQNASMIAFLITFLFIIIAGLVSSKSKIGAVLLVNSASILISIVLGKIWITPPNESWFNPFGMNFAVVFVGVLILIGLVLVRFFTNIFINRKTVTVKVENIQRT